MDTEKLRAFLTVVETGTISGAADALGYTVSGVSRLVASLEEDAGFPLLRRYHSGVTPTAECATLLPVIRELVGKAEIYRQTAAQLCGLEAGSITVGTAYSGYCRPLAQLISDFIKEYPGIHVQIVEETSSRLSELVSDGSVDFCIISQRRGSYRWIPLLQDELVALVACGHPAVAEGRYSPADFAVEPFIELYPQYETDNSLFFKEAGIRPNTHFSTCDINAGVAMVEAGLGVTLINGLLAKGLEEGVVALPLCPPEKIDIGIATPAAALAAPAGKRFSAFAENRLAEAQFSIV